jgi:hypothetical protein
MPDQNGGALQNPFNNFNGMAQNLIGYRYTISIATPSHAADTIATRGARLRRPFPALPVSGPIHKVRASLKTTITLQGGGLARTFA